MHFPSFITVNSLFIIINSLSSRCQAERTGSMLDIKRFSMLVRARHYIDKTLILRHVMQNHYRYVLVTAPPGFGKTATLEMLKFYLSACIARNGSILGWKRKLYTFRNTQISLLQGPFFAHFAKNAVISLYLKYNGQVCGYPEVINILRDKIRASFFEHYYLRQSERLSQDEKTLYFMWTSVHNVEKMNERQVINGLGHLVLFLYKHHRGRQISVLIDDYDSIIRKAMFGSTALELHDIVGLLNTIIASLCEMKYEVRNVFITGVSHLFAGSLLSVPVRSLNFMRRHFLTHYLGFQEQEAFNTFRQFNLTQAQIDHAASKYRGYNSEFKKTVYNPWTVLQVAETSAVKNHWTKYNRVENIRYFFFNQIFLKILQRLLASHKVPIYFVHHGKLDLITELKQFIQGRQGYINMNLLLSYLYELGFLTLFADKEDTVGQLHLIIPNEEIKEYFLRELISTLKYKKHRVLEKVLHNITQMAGNDSFIAKEIQKYKSEIM